MTKQELETVLDVLEGMSAEDVGTLYHLAQERDKERLPQETFREQERLIKRLASNFCRSIKKGTGGNEPEEESR